MDWRLAHRLISIGYCSTQHRPPPLALLTATALCTQDIKYATLTKMPFFCPLPTERLLLKACLCARACALMRVRGRIT